jgi:hypothetical protein
MELRDQLLSSDLTAGPDIRSDSPPEPADLADVDRLICDLTALVDAGLVAVHDPVFGPARYGVVAGRDEVRLRVT